MGGRRADLVNSQTGKEALVTATNYFYAAASEDVHELIIPRSEWNRLHPEDQR